MDVLTSTMNVDNKKAYAGIVLLYLLDVASVKAIIFFSRAKLH